jgi:hypothetical protein
MFAEEQPQLLPLPVEPFRYYEYGTRTVHLDGCVEVASAYYAPPPGWLGREIAVQWVDHHVRLLDPTTGHLLREHRHQARGRHAIHPDDRPKRTPPRRILGVFALVKKHGPAVVADACAVALELWRRPLPLRSAVSRAPPAGTPRPPPGRSAHP